VAIGDDALLGVELGLDAGKAPADVRLSGPHAFGVVGAHPIGTLHAVAGCLKPADFPSD
jgi:hypothetical protein